MASFRKVIQVDGGKRNGYDYSSGTRHRYASGIAVNTDTDLPDANRVPEWYEYDLEYRHRDHSRYRILGDGLSHENTKLIAALFFCV